MESPLRFMIALVATSDSRLLQYRSLRRASQELQKERDAMRFVYLKPHYLCNYGRNSDWTDCLFLVQILLQVRLWQCSSIHALRVLAPCLLVVAVMVNRHIFKVWERCSRLLSHRFWNRSSTPL